MQTNKQHKEKIKQVEGKWKTQCEH
jgi:hypothetical protein